MIDKRCHALPYLDTYIHSCRRNKTCHNNLVKQAHNFQMQRNFTKIKKKHETCHKKNFKKLKLSKLHTTTLVSLFLEYQDHKTKPICNWNSHNLKNKTN